MPEERPTTPPYTPASVDAASARAGAAPLRGGDPERIGPYVPLGRLGGGGMGRVYLARPADDSPELAAVKVIRPEYAEDTEFRRRFEREAKVHDRVRTPYAPALLGTGFQETVLWTATEYLPGLNLADAVREHGALAPSGVWRLMAELGRALTALGTVGIVHRDLKPSNVVVSARGGGGHGARAQVIDFGISQAVDSSAITTTGGRVGTPAYMAPEYLREGRCDAASDVFSLAGTLVYAATGHAPFGDGTGVDVMHRVAFEDPRPEVMAGLATAAPELAELLTACLSKDPAGRPGPQQLVDAATTRGTPARVWQEPLHTALLERERACDVLRHAPTAGTRRFRSPLGSEDTAPTAARPVYGPHPPPGPYVPQDGPADGGRGGGGGRADGPGGGKRGRVPLALALATAAAVCAVALSAFLVTRPSAGESPDAGPAPNAGATASQSGGQAPPPGDDASHSPSEGGKESPRGDEDAGKGGQPGGAEAGGAPPDGSSASGGGTSAAGGDGTPGGDEGGEGADPRPTPEATSAPAEPSDPPWLSRCTYYSGSRLTTYGDSGRRVVQVQCMLAERGYDIGDAGVDGQFGDDTLASVRRFQGAEGLAVDGDVGPNTWSALRSGT